MTRTQVHLYLQANFAFLLLLLLPSSRDQSGTIKLIDLGHFTLVNTPWVRNGLGVNNDGILTYIDCLRVSNFTFLFVIIWFEFASSTLR
jgi:hypothetical protein